MNYLCDCEEPDRIIPAAAGVLALSEVAGVDCGALAEAAPADDGPASSPSRICWLNLFIQIAWADSCVNSTSPSSRGGGGVGPLGLGLMSSEKKNIHTSILFIDFYLYYIGILNGL